MKQKSKVRENSEYAKVPVFQWFFLLERLPLMDARAAINGIQEVSGSIPLISTIACFMACILRSTSLFLFPAKNEYRDDAGSFRRRLSILPPAEKGLFHESKDRENGLFVAPENSADNCIHRNTFAN